MKVFPATKIGWVNFMVFPFKAYMVITFPFFMVLRETNLGGLLFVTYGLCALPLLLGLIIQLIVCKREDVAQTLFFFIPAVLIVLWFTVSEFQRWRFVEREKWKTQTYEMDFDEVVRRLTNMELQSGGKWHWDQKQEDKPSNNILHNSMFVIREHQSGADAQLDADIVFEVSVWATETNRTKVTERTTKFGSNRDPDLHEEDLITETNRIHELIKAIQGNP
jgi:hypothetical protein